MKKLIHVPLWAEAIVFAAIVAGATVLGTYDKEAGWLWLIIVCWIMFRN